MHRTCSGILAVVLVAGALAAGESGPSAAPAPTATPTATPAEAPAAKFRVPEVIIDTRESPRMAEWAEKAKTAAVDALPLIMEILGEEKHELPEKVFLQVKPMKGVAHAVGNKIVCAEEWFSKRPGDIGAVVHEMCHVAQAYGNRRVPGWVTEGIADYVRWFRWEPENKRPKIDKAKSKYTDSYQSTAAFFDWLVKNKNKDFITKLNSDCRNGRFDMELFKTYCGADIDTLFAEYQKS